MKDKLHCTLAAEMNIVQWLNSSKKIFVLISCGVQRQDDKGTRERFTLVSV